MTKRITINGLKGIDSLIFDVPGPGVHVLSGTNGTGKSSLLACLLRLGSPNAFQIAFKTSKISKALDTFSNARITYEADDKKVTYKHSGVRWEPTPKRESKLVATFGFKSVIFAAANSDRIEPRVEDFKINRLKEAPRTLRDAAKFILGDDKFEDLNTINVKKGSGSEAFLLPDIKSTAPRKRTYFSEKNFSLGELCILKLLRKLETCPEGSMVLIDELELALHPCAQIRLFEHLETVSEKKKLTTIFSTHSASLIKIVNRNNLFFLERVEGKTALVKGCFPTYALGQLSLQEERSPDVALFVEDEQAQYIVDALVRILLKEKFSQAQLKPAVVVVPIGAISSVIAFLPKASSLLPDAVKRYALLDKDAHDDYIKPLEKKKNHQELAKIQKNESKIFFLPWTPELGICDCLRKNTKKSELDLGTFFNDNRISISQIKFNELIDKSPSEQRRIAKKLMAEVVLNISQITDKSIERVKQDVSEFFAIKNMEDEVLANNIRSLLLPLIR